MIVQRNKGINRNLLMFLTNAVLFFAFLVKSLVFLDPDFGWHLKIGQLTLERGIATTDPFSYTMPSFPFIDHEWLSNVLMWLTFTRGGLIVLAIMFSLVVFCTTKLTVSIWKKGWKEGSENDFLTGLFLMLLAGGVFIYFSGVRPQVESWLLLALFLLVIKNSLHRENYILLIPVLVVFWVNLHGSFALPIILLLIIIITRFFVTRRVYGKGLAALLLGIAASFINPYGPRIWHEVWMQMTDSSLRWTIAEWRPMVFSFNFAFVFLTAATALLIFKFRKSFSYEIIVINVFLFTQAILSSRHAPLWTVVSVPMLGIGIEQMGKYSRQFKFGWSRFNKIIKWAFWIILVAYILDSSISIYKITRGLSENTFYPKKALSFIKENPSDGKMFSEYGWGGYLIWKLPEKKVFIDGRMPSWRWKRNVPGELNYAMEDYKKITRTNIELDTYFDKFDVDTVLWPADKELSSLEKLETKIVSLFVKDSSEKKSFEQRIIDAGFKKVYQDEVAVIYRRQK